MKKYVVIIKSCETADLEAVKPTKTGRKFR
jgi:hypothetical protein